MKPPRVGIVMEYCEKGDLQHFLRKQLIVNEESLDINEKFRICDEIISALEYLHHRNIIHRDLKLENVLIDKNEQAKLMDFGLSLIVERLSLAKTGSIGTSIYMAPEVVTSSGEYDEKIDVFAFGICVYIIFTDEYFPYGQDAKQIEMRVAFDPNVRPNISKLEETVPEKHFKWLKYVIQKSWSHRSKERHSFSELQEIFKKRESDECDDSISMEVDRENDGENDKNVVDFLRNESVRKDASIKRLQERLEKMEVEISELRNENTGLRVKNIGLETKVTELLKSSSLEKNVKDEESESSSEEDESSDSD